MDTIDSKSNIKKEDDIKHDNKSLNYIVYKNNFVVKEVDPDGRKFDRVSRVCCVSNDDKATLILDYNNELVDLSDSFTISMMPKPKSFVTGENGIESEDKMGWRLDTYNKHMFSEYDYVMYGKLYDIKQLDNSRYKILVSFGGLLMSLEEDFEIVKTFELHEYYYLMIVAKNKMPQYNQNETVKNEPQE